MNTSEMVSVGEATGIAVRTRCLEGNGRTGEAESCPALAASEALEGPLPQWERKSTADSARLHATGCSAEASALLLSIKFKLETTKPEEGGIGIGL